MMINHWIFEFPHVFPSFSDKPLRPSVHLQLMRMPRTLGKEIFGSIGSISIANDISNLLPWTNLRDAVTAVGQHSASRCFFCLRSRHAYP